MFDLEIARKMDRIHSYPAKFTIDLALEYIEKFSKKGDMIYDPFLGSGTTLLAAKLSGRNGVGTDINFIALLISQFKLLNLNDGDFNNFERFISDFEATYSIAVNSTPLYNYPSIDHWFCKDSIKVLSLIKNNIENVDSENQKIFCKLVMSAIINSVSNQESDTRYAAVYKPQLNVDYVAELFIKKFKTTLELYKAFNKNLQYNVQLQTQLLNSKNCTSLIEKSSIDLILTSPPYPNTYDYYLYHKHRMNWLGYDVNFSMNNEIGSRREFSSLKKPKEKFDNDMYMVLKECNEVLKEGGITVIVMGDGKIQGQVYEAKSNIEMICDRLNWQLIDYSYTLLDQTSRSFQKSYRTKGKKEHVLVFRKG